MFTVCWSMSSEGATIDGLYVDRYELAMALAYWREGRAETPACFDYFFRSMPFQSGYVVFAGLETLLEGIEDFRFGEGALEYLAENGFPDDFLEYLRNLRFGGAIHSVREGEVVFPLEPVLRVEGGLLETQLLETLVLNVLNFQSLIATKAARCTGAAGKRPISEFGLRRAQGPGGLWASRAAAVGGCASTSNLAAGRRYGLPTAGTMAHAYVQSHDHELEAFRRFADIHKSNAILVLDTYDTLHCGLDNAVRVAKEMAERGEQLRGVRLDSGDLAYMARQVRARLDAEGLDQVLVVASNQLDEYVIRSLNEQGAPIDLFGVGTKLATGLPDGALDGIYKLSAAGGTPRMKFSESLSKASLPAVKSLARYTDEEGLFQADAIHLADQPPPVRMLHPYEPTKRLSLVEWTSECLISPVMESGERCDSRYSVPEIAEFSRERRKQLPLEFRRFENPHIHKVGLSPELHQLREDVRSKLSRTHS